MPNTLRRRRPKNEACFLCIRRLMSSFISALSSSTEKSSGLAIRSHVQNGRFREALSLYISSHKSGDRSDNIVVTAAIKACAQLSNMYLGSSLHTQMYKHGYSSDVYVGTSLVGFYSRLDGIQIARKVFDEMPVRNVVSWNTILAAYLKDGFLESARKVFDEMPIRDVISWNSMVSGYAKAGDMQSAIILFCEMPEKNPASWNSIICGWIDCGKIAFARDLFDQMHQKSTVSWVTMISGYTRSGDVDSAKSLFDQMDERDLFSWNAMITCYAQSGQPREAIELFNQMRKLYINGHLYPDKMTFSSIISACSQLGDLRFGLWIEGFMRDLQIELDEHLRTAFIDFYAKCGSIERASELFIGSSKRDLVSYSAMILGCGMNGKASDAIHLFDKMLDDDIVPNSVTFTGLLAAYRHAGLVEEGIRCFTSMWRDHKVAPSCNHYAIMVDLFGRVGRLDEAYRLIKSMPMQPHVGAWGALLLACRLHGNAKLGEIAAHNCFKLDPKASGYYVLLANIYAEAGEWDKAKRLREVMTEKGVSTSIGFSWVEFG